jgi:hypothetical protein
MKKEKPIHYIRTRSADGKQMRTQSTRQFLEEAILEKFYKITSGMSNEKCNELAKQFVGLSGSKLALSLEFDAKMIQGKIEVFSPRTNQDPPVKSLLEQAADIVNMQPEPEPPKQKARGKTA